jgi:hypothetical protein
MAAATHFGHCQLCGALQKLPGGRLSLHGYTTRYGYFSGVCRGARHLPFEKSYHLVLDAIDNASKQLHDTLDHQAALRTHVDETTEAKTRVWVEDLRTRKHSYRWENVTLVAERRDHEGGTNLDMTPYGPWFSVRYSYTSSDGKKHDNITGAQPYEAGNESLSVEELRQKTVLKINGTYADWLEHEVDSLRRYVAWQRERIANWTEQPLLEVKPKKDTSAFKPTEPRY